MPQRVCRLLLVLKIKAIGKRKRRGRKRDGIRVGRRLWIPTNARLIFKGLFQNGEIFHPY